MANPEQLAVPALAFVAVLAIGGAVIAARQARTAALAPRLFDGGEAPVEQPAAAAPILSRIGALVSFGRKTQRLAEHLTRAGFHAHNAAEVFLGIKILLLLGGALTGAAAMIPLPLPPLVKTLVIVGMGGVLSFVPNLVVASRQSARRNQVRRHLPDATDLLQICVSSGMGLDMAWNVVSEEVRPVSPVLADEMALTNLEIQLNASRHTAMRHMAQRTGANELISMVAVLIQSDRFGTSVADALRMFAKSLRDERSQRAEEAAEKMSVKLILPMVLFIFPSAFVVMCGPAAIKMLELFSHN
jgi:tight adherence protein C